MSSVGLGENATPIPTRALARLELDPPSPLNGDVLPNERAEERVEQKTTVLVVDTPVLLHEDAVAPQPNNR